MVLTGVDELVPAHLHRQLSVWSLTFFSENRCSKATPVLSGGKDPVVNQVFEFFSQSLYCVYNPTVNQVSDLVLFLRTEKPFRQPRRPSPECPFERM